MRHFTSPVLLADVLPDIGRMVDEAIYNVLLLFAEIHWSLQRAAFMMGYTIKVVTQWLIDHAFVPLITQTNSSLSVAVSAAFVIALLVLGITYMLAAFIRLEVVNFRSAATWYVAGALFFTIGPQLYQSMNDFRLQVGQLMYASTLSGLQSTPGTSFNSLTQVSSTDLDMGPLCDHFDLYLEGATAPGPIDGLDIALTYLRGHGRDVMGYESSVSLAGTGCAYYPLNTNPMTEGFGTHQASIPMDWTQATSYFDGGLAGYRFANMDSDEIDTAISLAGAAQGRAFTAWPLILFGIAEQIVHLLITIAMGVTFVSFAVAILFAFFKRTEAVAQAVVDQWLELIVQTAMIGLVQALVIAFFLTGAATGNVTVVIGIGLICLVFMLIVLWSGVKAVWNSFNRLFGAVGQAAGNVFVTPGQAASAVATAGTSAIGSSAGASASVLAGMSALRSGATRAQAAGLMMGGSSALSNAARTLAYLPGARNTSLGNAAEQFTEGSITREVGQNLPGVGKVAAPLVGARLLTNRAPDRATYDDAGHVVARPMLVPAVGEGLEKWTVPRGARRRQPTTPPNFFEDEDGQMLPISRLRQPRMGTFTPAAVQPDAVQQAERRQSRSDYADEMRGEELEQHLSDVMRTSTGVASPLAQSKEGASDSLAQAAARLNASAQQLVGELRVPDVASVLGDVIGAVKREGTNGSQQRIDTVALGDRMAQTVGVTPDAAIGSPVAQDAARFGLFLNQALALGLNPAQTAQVVREVQASPEGKMTLATREMLDKQVQSENNLSWVQARDRVNQIEHSANILPREVVVNGAIQIPREAMLKTETKDDA